jgi:formate dehydrogenase subunit gamma
MLSDVSPRHAPWSEEVALDTIGAHAGQRGPLLPVLHALQETFGYVDPRAVPLVAKTLNLSRAEVYGVLTFYSDLRTTPPGRVRVQVCRGEACQSVGAHALARHASKSLGVSFGGTAADGSVTLDEVFCLGNCALGPTVTVDGHLHGRVDAADLDRLVHDGAMNNSAMSSGGADDSAGSGNELPNRDVSGGLA